MGYAKWLTNLYESVEIMGEGNVSPNMVCGLEVVQPSRFTSIKEAVDSARQGFGALMSRGVVPHLDTWCIEPATRLEGYPPVTLEFLLRADTACYEMWRKYSLPPFTGYGPMGAPDVAVHGNSASVDVGTHG